MTTMVALSSDDYSDQEPVADDIKELIRQSLDVKLENRRVQKSHEVLCETIVVTLEEFMRNFMVIGFDLNNEPLVITKASSPLDGEALSSLVKKCLTSAVKDNG